MTPLAATVATLVVFFLPGLLVVALAGGSRSKLDWSLVEQTYLVLAGSLVVSGWVGLLAAELGFFSPPSVAGIVAFVTVLVAALARRRFSLRPGAVRGGELALAGGILAFGLLLYFPPYEYILGGRDPGIYMNAGFHLANEGELTTKDPIVESIPSEAWPLFFRVDKELPPWSHLRFQGFLLESPATARVVPHGLHLYPVWIGMASALYQTKAGLYATPFFALMGVLGFALASRRLFGAEVAAMAAAWMTVFQIQIWFARFPNSEVVVQFLYATTLLLFYFMEERRSRLAGALAGVALGSTLLTRFETILFLVPLAVFFGWKRLKRSLGMPELCFGGAFALVAIHAALHDRLVAWPYVSSILGRHYWRILGDNLLLFSVLAIVAFFVVDRLAMKLPPRFLDLVDSRRARLAAALLLLALASWAYFVRPFWHGPRTAPHDAEAFLRLGWYLYPMGLALGVSGGMLLLSRAKKSQVFFLLVGLTFSLFFFYKVRVWHDHYFAMRRFVPIILPSFFAAMAFFLVQIRSGAGRVGLWGSRAVALLLFLVFLNDGRRIWRHEEFPGAIDFVEELARHVQDDDIVLFPRREGLHLLELPLSELEGKNVLEFYTLKPDRALLESLLETWRGRYGDVYFVTNYKISLSGLFTRHVKDFWFATRKYEFAYTRPPRTDEPFHLRFTLSKAVDLNDLAARVPKLRTLDVGGSDDLQVAWFHEKELEPDGTSFRWSQRTSSVFLPTVKGETVAIRMASAKEDEVPLRRALVALDGQKLGDVELTREFATYRFRIPDTMRDQKEPPYAILTLSTQPWRPSNYIEDSTDVRDLGVRVDGIAVED